MPLPIPLIEARGTPYDAGAQIGTAARDSLRQMYAETRAEYGDRWANLLEQAIPFRAATEKRLPNVMLELRGCAAGAGIPADDLFVMSVEELLYEEVRGSERGASKPARSAHHPEHSAGPAQETAKGCSDLAAAPPATEDGHVWLAHNNDLGKSAQDHLFVTRLCVTGEPEILAVTVGGLFISIGVNSAGISLTGNQLTANDARVGVPRLLVVRDILAQRTLDDALAAALMPDRASSYNNIIAYAPRTPGEGRIVNVEGSATAAALTWDSDVCGVVAHTNHYVAPEMLHLEADLAHVPMSAARCARALDYAQKYHGRIGFEVCRRLVRDHVYAPWSVCKHAGQSVTVFSALIDLTALKIWLARGNPCQSEFAPLDL